MLTILARLILGPVAEIAARLCPDVYGLATPGRPPRWPICGDEKSRPIKA
jgi:hypothetical protein